MKEKHDFIELKPEGDFWYGVSIKCGKQRWISLVKGQHWYSRTDFNAYFSEAKKELELRIPDKYLIAKGWKV